MNKKLERYYAERAKNAATIDRLAARNGELDRKIMEGENLEIRSVMRSENITLEELLSLVLLKRSGQQPIPPAKEMETFKMDFQADAALDDDDLMEDDDE